MHLNDGTLNDTVILEKRILDSMCVNQIGNLYTQFDKMNAFPDEKDSTSKYLGKDKMGFDWAIDAIGRNGSSKGNLYWGGIANTFFNIYKSRGKTILFFSNVLPWGNKYTESILFKAQQLIYV